MPVLGGTRVASAGRGHTHQLLPGREPIRLYARGSRTGQIPHRDCQHRWRRRQDSGHTQGAAGVPICGARVVA